MMPLAAKDFPQVDPFAAQGVSGFVISNNEDVLSCGSISSDHESDDQAWSPTLNISPVLPAIPEPEPLSPRAMIEPIDTRRRSVPQPRWPSTSPRSPRETRAKKTSRSLSDSMASVQSESQSPSTTITAHTPSQTPTMRNAAKRAAHNIIEKRYRTNMNAKFVALEKAMATPHGVSKNSSCSSSSPSVTNPASRPGAAASLKKSEILSNAITYIQELQEENRAMQKEMALLKQNLLPGGIWRHKREY
ncbi:hypothetical protein ASPZODRAFT_126553 [Penicilliopsis zonata CBS 506.65]|uniref:BHLH domain-containing protein n=1 Tax=Penicilliopsis zonata CBS 506.65 TaxID=1073090 RepID=A0A1L9SU34_9EURO|nr:hypothetical protein ASPZODRAFT_126553 [Penicilliopsis zonata CBS 506.65]OJJ50646.1 hypothetical protein ASPZODRAFT_126553 [Penicilliopsis zonata CBS 506.65]